MTAPTITPEGFGTAQNAHQTKATAATKHRLYSDQYVTLRRFWLLVMALLFAVAPVARAAPMVFPRIEPVAVPHVMPTVVPTVKPEDQGFYAIDFKSTVTTATYSDNLFDGLTAFTVEFWCYADDSFLGTFWQWSDVGLGSAFFFDFGRLGVRLNNAATSASLGSMGNTDWQGSWFHVAFRWQQGGKPEILAWRGGVEYTQTTQGGVLSDPLSASGETFYLGSSPPPYSPLNARLTAIRLWNYKRTDEQIRADRTNPFASGTGLVASWPIIDAAGQIIRDVSGNGHHLTRGLDETVEDLDPGTMPEIPWTEITADGPQ